MSQELTVNPLSNNLIQPYGKKEIGQKEMEAKQDILNNMT